MSIVKLNNQGVKNATAFGSITGLGSMIFIKKLTASSSATLSFVDGSDGVVLDDTYKEYVFTFKNIHPASNDADFQFNLSADSGSNYNVTKTTTAFNAYHYENDSSGAGLSYDTSIDLAQSTSDQLIFGNQGIGNDNDQSLSGSLMLFNPSSTNFVKHFKAVISNNNEDSHAQVNYSSGYFNTTAAITGLDFKMSSGNIDSGVIKLYGVS